MGQCSPPVTHKIALPLAFSLIPAPAFAHLVNTNVDELYAGMLHPLTSVEHVWPAAALVLLAGWCGARVSQWTAAGAYLLLDSMTEGAPLASHAIGLPTEEQLLALVTTEALTLPVIAAAFLAACGWGAAHALTPGHGKPSSGHIWWDREALQGTPSTWA